MLNKLVRDGILMAMTGFGPTSWEEITPGAE